MTGRVFVKTLRDYDAINAVLRSLRRSKDANAYCNSIYVDDDIYKASVAYNMLSGQVVGIHLYYSEARTPGLVSSFTWVRSAWRREGIAKKLWTRTLSDNFHGLMGVTCASEGGAALVYSMKKLFHDWSFDVNGHAWVRLLNAKRMSVPSGVAHSTASV